MTKSDLLNRVLSAELDNALRGDIVRYLFNEPSVKATSGVPHFINRIDNFSYPDIFQRMKSVAGGTASDVARVLNITSQGVNNQKQRGAISNKSILIFSLKTGVSLDWLVGGWDGVSLDSYEHIPATAEFAKKPIDTTSKFLSLVEVYDQQTGDLELKWCMTKHCGGVDNNVPLPENYAVLQSLITRYKPEAGTPDKVKGGNRRHFQVRRVFAYVLGEPKEIRALDHKVKSQTISHISDKGDRAGKTEFRVISSKDVCLGALKKFATQAGLKVSKPAIESIAWDYLIGEKSMSPQKWVKERVEEAKKNG